MQLLLSLLLFAPILLYLWFGIASFVAYRRTRIREWRFQVSTVALFCLNWILIALSPLLQKIQTSWWSWPIYIIYTFYPSLMIMRLPKLKNPQFVYHNRSDFLLLRQPTAVLPPEVEPASTPRQNPHSGLILFLVSNLVLALVSICSIELGTCNSLDIALRRSGCVGILPFGYRVQSIEISPDGTFLALNKPDHTVEIWRVHDQIVVQSLVVQDASIMSIAFSPDNATLATISYQNKIRLWSVKDGTLLRTLDAQIPLDYVPRVQFSQDSKLIVVSGAVTANTSVIHFWQISDGRLLRTLSTLGSNVVFSPDRLLFVTEGKNAV